MKPYLANMRVAVVDDDPTIVSLLQELLTEEGYAVTPFTDGAHLKHAAYQNSFDIVLTDINMPELNGIDLVRYLREINSTAKVIIMTAQADLETAIAAVKLGASDYLKKPFEDISHVINLVNRLAAKILSDRRKDSLVKAVVEKTKQLISHQKNSFMSDDVQKLLSRVEVLVKNLQEAEAGDDQESKKLTGTIQEIGLPNLMQMLSLVGKSGKFFLYGDRFQGEMWYVNGRIVHAICGRLTEERAIFRLLNQEGGQFQFVISDEEKMKAGKIDTPTDFLILDCLRRLDEYRALGKRVPPDNLHLRVRGEVPPQVSREDMKILFLVGRYARVRDLIDFSPVPELETIHALIRLRMANAIDAYYPTETPAELIL